MADSNSASVVIGVMNAFLGSFLSASGLILQKLAHNRNRKNPGQGVAHKQRIFYIGLSLLALGQIAALVNLGLLPQSVNAPLASITLIFSALLSYKVLHEPFTRFDFFSTCLIMSGIVVTVVFASGQSRSLSLDQLLDLYSRPVAIIYTISAAGWIVLSTLYIYRRGSTEKAFGLFVFGINAGLMSGFTSLTTKTFIEIAKTVVEEGDSSDLLRWEPYLFLLLIPCSLVVQLTYMNLGLKHFGAIQFVPAYQSFIIMANLFSGIVYLDEFSNKSAQSIGLFSMGVSITIFGISLLMLKVRRTGSLSANAHTAFSMQRIAELSAVEGVQHPGFSYPNRMEIGAFVDNVDPNVVLFSCDDARWANQTDTVFWTSDAEQAKNRFGALFASARSSIYYSMFLVDIFQPLGPSVDNRTIKDLIHEAVARGVKVHLLYNPYADYGNLTPEQLLQHLPPQVELINVRGTIGPAWWQKPFNNNSAFSYHHQKYLCIDGRTIMVTGCDINDERAAWLKPNRLGYYWHELAVVVPCTAEMFKWVRNNHKQIDMIPPLPLVRGMVEHNLFIDLIRNARQSIQIEHQIFLSGKGSGQQNRIARSIVDRVYQAVLNNESFYCFLLTNGEQKDEPSVVSRWYSVVSLEESQQAMEERALSYGLTLDQFYSHFFIGTMAKDGVQIKVHTNVIIQDGWRAIRTSSNLNDRSFSSMPLDTELGVCVEGESVARLQQDLFNKYMETQGVSYTFADIFENARNRRTLMVPLPRPTRPKIVNSLILRFFAAMSSGAMGGIRQAHWVSSDARVELTYKLHEQIRRSKRLHWLPWRRSARATAGSAPDAPPPPPPPSVRSYRHRTPMSPSIAPSIADIYLNPSSAHNIFATMNGVTPAIEEYVAPSAETSSGDSANGSSLANGGAASENDVPLAHIGATPVHNGTIGILPLVTTYHGNIIPAGDSNDSGEDLTRQDSKQSASSASDVESVDDTEDVASNPSVADPSELRR